MGKKGGICRLFCGQKSFYHNRAIFRALIGRELEYWLGNDVMVEQLPFSLGRDFPRNVNENGRQNLSNCCYCGKQIDNNFPWSILLSTIEMTSRSSIFSKLYRQTTKPAVRGSTWVFSILTSFLWSVRVENCCPCVNYLLAAFISCFNLFWFRWFIRSDSQHA